MGNLVANQAINKKESGIFSKLYFGGKHQFCHNRSFIWHHWLAAENWPQLWQTKTFEVCFFEALHQIKISDFRQNKSRFSKYEEKSKNWAAVLLPTSLFLKFWCGHETWSWDLKFSTLHIFDQVQRNPPHHHHYPLFISEGLTSSFVVTVTLVEVRFSIPSIFLIVLRNWNKNMNYSKRCRRLTYLGRHDAVQDEIRGTVTEGKQVHRLGYIEIYIYWYIKLLCGGCLPLPVGSSTPWRTVGQGLLIASQGFPENPLFIYIEEKLKVDIHPTLPSSVTIYQKCRENLT